MPTEMQPKTRCRAERNGRGNWDIGSDLRCMNDANGADGLCTCHRKVEARRAANAPSSFGAPLSQETK